MRKSSQLPAMRTIVLEEDIRPRESILEGSRCEGGDAFGAHDVSINEAGCLLGCLAKLGYGRRRRRD
jgi:hypothetical protein